MNILIVDDFCHKQQANKFSAGSARVTREQARLFSYFKHNVVYLTSADSDDLKENYFQVKSKVASSCTGRSLKGSECEILLEEIQMICENHKVDLVLFHTMIAKYALDFMHQVINVPRIFTLHANRANGILGSDLSDSLYYQIFQTFAKNGGKVVCVSPSGMDWWNKVADFGYLDDATHCITDWISPAFYSDLGTFQVDQAEDYATVVSRNSPDKNALQAIEILESLNIPAKVFLSKQAWTPIEYAAAIDKPRNNIEIIYNASQEEVYAAVAKSKFNLNCSPNETAGLVAVEAALMGVPTVVVYESDTKHGNVSILETANISSYSYNTKYVDMVIVEKLIEKASQEDFATRQQRSILAKQAYSYEAWYKRLLEIVEKYENK